MLDKIIDFYKDSEILNQDEIYNLRQYVDYYKSITTSTKLILLDIKNKYSYSNYSQFLKEPYLDTILEFCKDCGEYRLAVNISDREGVHDCDPKFGCFIDEIDYNKLKTINNETDNLYKILDNLFYTWVCHMWQDIKGYELAMKIGIEEHGIFFSLNDFTWYDLSNFATFDESLKPIDRFFNRNLSTMELYSRADLTYSAIEPTWKRKLSKESEVKTFFISKSELQVETYEHGQLTDSKSEKVYFTREKKFEKQFIGQINSLLNDNWVDTTFGT